jgi:hypothetical protein
LDSSAVENPAYCRIVHGRLAYMVARTPREKGANPGSESSPSTPARSAAVYSGRTSMPSGVCQISVSASAPFRSLAARLRQSSRFG